MAPRLRGGTHVCAAKRSASFRESLSLLGARRETDPGNKRSKIKADFVGASSPDSLLNDSQFAVHAWDSKVHLLTDYLFTEDENQCRDF